MSPSEEVGDSDNFEVEGNKSESGSNPDSESVHQLDLSSEALVTSTLNIRGNKIITTLRPRTSPYKRTFGDNDVSRDDLRSPDSIAATYTIRENLIESHSPQHHWSSKKKQKKVSLNSGANGK